VQPVVVFAPAPFLTVTVEPTEAGDEIHVHAGGQGVWVAQMLSVLDVPVTLCGVFAGESGTVVELLLQQRDMQVRGVTSQVRGSAYVHDRRDGERRTVAHMDPEPLSRHDADELYGAMLAEGMNASVCVLTGSTREVVPVDAFRRLAADLRSNGRTVVADLSGEQLSAALEGGLTVLKVAHDELIDAGWTAGDDDDALAHAMHRLVDAGTEHVVVSRAERGALLLSDGAVSEIGSPELEAFDHRGAGDSMTAGIAAGLAQGLAVVDAVSLGAAAGSVNVTRHGLASGDRATIDAIVPHIEVRTLPDRTATNTSNGANISTTPDDLAARARAGS
jgi:1-phosphofructokinase